MLTSVNVILRLIVFISILVSEMDQYQVVAELRLTNQSDILTSIAITQLWFILQMDMHLFHQLELETIK